MLLLDPCHEYLSAQKMFDCTCLSTSCPFVKVANIPVGGKIRKLPVQWRLFPHNFHCWPDHRYVLNAVLIPTEEAVFVVASGILYDMLAGGLFREVEVLEGGVLGGQGAV